MKTLTRGLVAALGLLAGSLAVGCSLFTSEPATIDDLRAYVRAEISDEERAQAMLVQIDQAAARLRDFNLELAKLDVEMRRVNADRAAERDAVDAVFGQHNAIRNRIQEDLVDSLLAVRELATEDEWGDLVDLSMEAYMAQMAQAGLTTSVTGSEESDG